MSGAPITIFIKATNQNNLRDLIRSLINNAEKRENYQIFVGCDPSQDDKWLETMDEFIGMADIFLMKELDDPKAIDTQLIWMLTDEVFILGFQWDKRLLFYRDKYPDDIIVMLPSGYKSYGTKSETEIANIAERHPVISAQWAELVGLQDVEMICRSLFLKHGIDRRVDLRLVDVQWRGGATPPPVYKSSEVERKADRIAAYIKQYN